MPFQAPPVILCFGASDPTGGSGVQGDVLTIAALGGHPATVLTAIEARDTRRREHFWALDSDWVDDQARGLLEDMQIAAFKIGTVGSPEIASVIAEILSDYPDLPVVLDPDLRSAQEDAYSDDELLDAIGELLLPLCSIITLNASELRRIALEEDDEAEPSLSELARRVLEFGAGQVLLSGGHEHGPQLVNTLYGAEGVGRADAWERISGNFLGSGGTLAAALATRLAFGADLSTAVREAQDFTWHSLKHGFQAGMGMQLPDRFFGLRG